MCNRPLAAPFERFIAAEQRLAVKKSYLQAGSAMLLLPTHGTGSKTRCYAGEHISLRRSASAKPVPHDNLGVPSSILPSDRPSRAASV